MVIVIDDGTLVLYKDIMEKIYLFRDAFILDLQISGERGWREDCGPDPSDGPGRIHLACMRGAGLYAWRWCGPICDRAGIADRAAAEVVTAADVARARARGVDGLIVRQHPSFVCGLMAGGWDVEPLGQPTLRDGHPVVAVCARPTPDTAAATRRFFGLESVPVAPEPASPRYPLPLPVSSPDTEIRLRA